MGLRELLILILILAIVVVVLRGLYVALRSRRGQIKIALEKNIPEYDLEELEMRELPNGGARQVERSFAEVLRQNSAHAAKANATATGKPSTLRPGAKGLKTNLSRTGSRPAAVAPPQAHSKANADEAVKTTPVTAHDQPVPELDFAPADEPVLVDEGLDAQQGPTGQPRHEDQDDPADYESALAEDPSPLFDEDPLVSVGDDTFANDEDDTDVFGEKIQHQPQRSDDPEAELDDVLDELLQKATPEREPQPDINPRRDPEREPEPEIDPREPEPEIDPDYQPEPEIEPDYEPEPEIDPEHEPEPEVDPEPEYQPEYEPEPEPEPRPEPAVSDAAVADPDPLIDDVADDTEEACQQEPTQEQQADSQSDPLPVEDDMPDFDNETIADPEPQPEKDDSFIASRDDELDVLFDDDDRERRIAALEERQDSAPRRFMSWFGGTFGRSAGAATGDEKRVQNDAVSVEGDMANEEADELVDDYGDDDGILSVRETQRPGAAERARAEQLRQSQLDLDDEEDNDDDDLSAQEQEPRAQEPPAYSEVLVINVMARPGTELAGDDLLPVLMSNGLKFGEMSIFHRHTDKIGGRKNGPVMFSVANALNPGTFDLNRISEFATLGVCFFMTLPNVVNNMMAFEQMLATARKVQAALDAELKDDNRSVMTAQTVEHYRQRIRDFELQELKNANSR